MKIEADTESEKSQAIISRWCFGARRGQKVWRLEKLTENYTPGKNVSLFPSIHSSLIPVSCSNTSGYGCKEGKKGLSGVCVCVRERERERVCVYKSVGACWDKTLIHKQAKNESWGNLLFYWYYWVRQMLSGREKKHRASISKMEEKVRE